MRNQSRAVISCDKAIYVLACSFAQPPIGFATRLFDLDSFLRNGNYLETILLQVKPEIQTASHSNSFIFSRAQFQSWHAIKLSLNRGS